MSSLRRFWFAESTWFNAGLARVFVCAFFVSMHAGGASRVRTLAALPRELFDATSFYALTHAPLPPSLPVLQWIAGVGALCVVTALLGLFTRVSLAITTVSLIVTHGAVSSLGWTNHNTGMAILAGLILVFAPGVDDFSLDALIRAVRERRRARLRNHAVPLAPLTLRSFAPSWQRPAPVWPQRLVLCALAAAYVGGGVNKLRHGGVAWLDGAPLAFALEGKHRHADRWYAHANERGALPDTRAWKDPWGVDTALYNPRPTIASRAMARFHPVVVAMAVGTIAFELGFLFAPFFLRRVRWFLGAGLVFHILTAVAFGIFFFAFVAAYAVAFPWALLRRRADESSRV